MLAAGADIAGVGGIARAAQGTHHLVGHELREADDGVQRRAQFVAHIGEEFGLAAAGELGLFLGGDQRQLGFLAVGDVERRRYHDQGLVVGIAQQGEAVEQHAALAVRLADFLFPRAWLALAVDDLAMPLHRHPGFGVAAQRARQLADHFRGRPAEALGERAVDEHEAAVAIGGADHDRHRVDHAQQHLVTALQLIAMALLVDLDFFLEGRGALLQHQLLALQGEQIVGADAEFTVIDRAQQIIRRARLERLEPQIAVLIGGDHDDRQVGAVRLLAQLADQIGAVHLRHVEVGDQQVGRRLDRILKRRDRVREGAHLDILPERTGKPFEDFEIGYSIVDDRDDLTSHARFRLLRRTT